MAGNLSLASPFLSCTVSPCAPSSAQGRRPLGSVMNVVGWQMQIWPVHRARAKMWCCFGHHACGSAPEPIKVRDVTSPGGRNSRRADLQQDSSWDVLLPSGSKRAAQDMCISEYGFPSFSSFFHLFERLCCILTWSAAHYHNHCDAVLAVKCLMLSHGAHLLQRLLPGLHVPNESLILMHLPSA